MPCQGPPPCDPEIRNSGEVMAVLRPGSLTPHEIEAIVADFRRLTGLRIDWHYFGGRPVVRWLREAPKPTKLSMAEYHQRLDEITDDVAEVWEASQVSASDVRTDLTVRLDDFVATARPGWSGRKA